MSDWRWRLAVYFLIVGVFMPNLANRGSSPSSKRPVFLRHTTGLLLVRVIDTEGSAQIYRFSDGTMTGDVKIMTHRTARPVDSNQAIWSRKLKDGDVVSLTEEADDSVRITVKSMAAAERVALGIPLDPDKMSLDDWMFLPGIGRSLALKIVLDRQKNGDFLMFENVSRVPGVGAGRIGFLSKFF